jgi:peptidoglycan hydrolase CwlO-like protein
MADMMGSMFAAHIVASEIAHQNWMNRFEAESHSRLADDNAILRQRDRELAERHNQLARAYNELLQRMTALGQDYDRQAAVIARLEADKAADAAEIERLKVRLQIVTTEAAMLRKMDKEQNPDAYPLG